MNANITACIFDLDGLLINSERCYTIGANEVLAPYGKSLTWDVKSQIMGRPSLEAAKIVVDFFKLPISAEQYAKLAQEKVEDLFRKVEMLPGALRLLQHLKKCNIPIAIATGSVDKNFKIKTGHLPELVELFNAENIVTSQHPKLPPNRAKPWPDIFEIAARTLNLNIDGEEGAEVRKSILVFEDGIPGVKAANSAGMPVVWVPDAELKEFLGPSHDVQATQILTSLEEFKPEQWNVPPY